VHEFMFATGIECSYPTIEHGRWRMDQLYDTGHMKYWRQDLELVRQLGLRYLRYGPPLHKIFMAPGRYDWQFTDQVFSRMRELGIEPIVDLCHFGLPAWLGTFQNKDFPKYLAEYASVFANRFPWVELYTPVNEMFVAAKMSALYGNWNEQLASEQAFVTAACNLATASVLMIEAIRAKQPRAIFITSESSEYVQACCPDERTTKIADFENQRRFIALDLLYGHEVRDDIRRYLNENGLAESEYSWFMNARVTGRAIIGVDYYDWNEKLVDSDGILRELGHLFGWSVLATQYWERYRKPLMHTETNCPDAAQGPAWLWKQWHNVQYSMSRGIPVVGFTWYSLLDQIDWDRGLSRALGNIFPVGLYDLNRDPRITAQAYQQLIEMFCETSLPDIQLEERMVSEKSGAMLL
jgi:beta-glucosidase/6-phospho-beta-glucosidase/beta-galactosidase